MENNTGLFVYFVGKLMLDKNTTYLLSLSSLGAMWNIFGFEAQEF